MINSQCCHGKAKVTQSAESSHNYKHPSYVVGSKVWINKSIYNDAYSKSQKSNIIASRRLGLFTVKERTGKNAFRLDLSRHFKIHPVVHLSHTMPIVKQPHNIGQPIQPIPEPIPTVKGSDYIVDKIMNRKNVEEDISF